jgi:hypothetical protein
MLAERSNRARDPALRREFEFSRLALMLTSIRRFCRTGLVAVCLIAVDARAQNDAVSQRAAIEAMYPIMMHALETKNFGRARNICDQAILWEPQNPVHHYNLACIEAQAGGDRLPHAWGALELAIALGFNDADHMKTDPDLLPLHRDPRFVDLVRKVAFRVSAGDDIAATNAPSTSAPTSTAPLLDADQPVAQAFHDDLPVGLYFMTRYSPATQLVEKAVWYFTPGGEVYSQLEDGFSQADLSRHTGPRGKLKRGQGGLEITWSDGAKNTSKVERDGPGFVWNMCLFVPVVPFDHSSEAAGIYECVESLPPGIGTPVPLRLELRPDGTFTWEGVAFTSRDPRPPIVKSGPNQSTSGRWEVSGFSLQLNTIAGVALRRFTFPDDDEKTVIKPDRMFFGGLMFKRRP